MKYQNRLSEQIQNGDRKITKERSLLINLLLVKN